MRKLLLFAILFGFGSISIAQTISIDSFVLPSGDVVANKTTSIKLKITNNSSTISYPAGTSFYFLSTLDGANVTAIPPTALIPASYQLFNVLTPGESREIFLTQSWGAAATIGVHNLCIDLFQTLIPGGIPSANTDQNKKICQDFNFIWPLGISIITETEITKIGINEDLMTVFIKGNSNTAQIQVMSITGQIVKSINATTGGKNFSQVIDITDLTAGVYIVTVQTENGKAKAQKVFIQ